MKCNCGADTRVVDTRLVDGRQWRRRSCVECGVRFNTLEVLETDIQIAKQKPEVVPEKEPKPAKNPLYVSEKTVEKINEKKKKARHLIEDMKYWEKQENDDIFWSGDYQDEYNTY